MRLSFSSVPNTPHLLGPWVERLRTRLDLPLLLRWQGGSGFKLGEFDQPRVTIDVLDASRRLVPLDLRNIDRRNAEGYLKTGKEMLAAADEVARLAGRRDAETLIGDTRMLATRCRLDPQADIGLGEIHLPEFDVLDVRGSAPDAMAALRLRCDAGIAARYGTSSPAIEARLADELTVIDTLGFATYFLTVAEVVAMIGRLGIRCAARGSGAGSLICASAQSSPVTLGAGVSCRASSRSP